MEGKTRLFGETMYRTFQQHRLIKETKTSPMHAF